MKKAAIFRKLMEAEEILIAPGVYDGITAKLAQAAGFEAAAVSGAGISESRLAKPDFGMLGLADSVDQCRHLADCVDIPLQADAETGYGNAINVYYAVRAFEQAGVACVMIEDQAFPPRCGQMSGTQVISAAEMVKKVEAAVSARRDSDFCIMARTDAASTLGIEEAIRRANLYADAGADFVMANALKTREDIRRFAGEATRPTVVNFGFGVRKNPGLPIISPRELQKMGVAMVKYPRLLISSAVRGMWNGVEAFKSSLEKDQVIDRPDLAASAEELADLMDTKVILGMHERFRSEEG